MHAVPQDLVLVLADISGYTRFMLNHRKSLAHSQMIVADLLRTILEQAENPFAISKLEGDAVFMYTPVPSGDGQAEQRLDLGRCICCMFAAFRAAVVRIHEDSICKCSACSGVGDLKLKVFVHSGAVALAKVGDFTELQGIDAIVIHRLSKNTVEGSDYIMVTEQARQHLQFDPTLQLERSEETYDDVGVIPVHVAATPWLDARCTPRPATPSKIAQEILRNEIQKEYRAVALTPHEDFHFHTGRTEAENCEYAASDIACAPVDALNSFAGTGNPFALGAIEPGERVVDIGCGGGFDAFIAANKVGPEGAVIGVEMTPEMLAKARHSADEADLPQLEFREGFAEALPVEDGWADVVISNGVLNLCPSKPAALGEMLRVLKPGGRLQIADIIVQKPVPESAKRNIDLWTG